MNKVVPHITLSQDDAIFTCGISDDEIEFIGNGRTLSWTSFLKSSVFDAMTKILIFTDPHPGMEDVQSSFMLHITNSVRDEIHNGTVGDVAGVDEAIEILDEEGSDTSTLCELYCEYVGASMDDVVEIIIKEIRNHFKINGGQNEERGR